MNKNSPAAKGMTVGELRALLEDFSDDTPVHFAYNYGDYGRTQVAQPVKNAEEMPIVWSDYHDMPRLADDEEEADEGEELQAVILS